MPATSPRPAPGRRPAQGVTSAPPSLGGDRSRRVRHYLIAMGVRTVSFPLAVWAFTAELYVLAWILAGLATFIPSFAVMIANAVDERRRAPGRPVSPVQGLGPAAAEPAARAPEEAPPVVRGEVVSGEVVRRDSPPTGGGPRSAA